MTGPAHSLPIRSGWCFTPRSSASLYRALVCAAFMFATLVPVIGRAEVSAQLTVAAPKVELGQPLRVELTVSSDEGAPQSPRLDAPPGFVVRGPTVSTRFSTSISGWSAQTRREITASWLLTSPKTGTFQLGPARAVVEGRTIESNLVKFQVVAPGTLPQQDQSARQQRRRPGSLFDDDDFFPGLGRGGRSVFEDMLQRQARDLYPAAPPGYRLPSARDATAFLDASVSPKRVVVGQQVTLRIIAYGAAGRFRESDTREPRRPDFFSVPLTETSAREQVYSVSIGDRDYLAIKVREFALFPLKSGQLEIGPMTMAFYGSNYVSPSTQQPLVRQSQTLTVNVSEPPTEGRPLGYQIGDVGEFTLSASVSPRSVTVGGSVSIVATLEGVGNLPDALRMPEQKGIEWLEPTLSEQIQPDAQGRLGGRRTFTYVVQATQPGTFNLGELSLPYYNAKRGRYQTARAALGELVVEPAAPAAGQAGSTGSDTASVDSAPEVKLSELARARRTLSPYTPRRSAWAFSPWLWLVLLGAPLSVVVAQLSASRVRSWLSQIKDSRSSLGSLAQQELLKAKALAGNKETDSAIAALERALFLGIEHATGIKARALLRDQLQATLTSAGLEASTAELLTSLLTQLETYRFARQGEVDELVRSSEQALSSLQAHQRSGRAREAA